MGKVFERLEPQTIEFIERQHLFFVATAPLDADGLINLSPKGCNTFTVVDPQTVAYLDLMGSGIETVAHIRQNGRLTVMFCSFEGPPNILRLYGRGEVVEPSDAAWPQLRARFPAHVAERSIVILHVQRVSTACGFGVPRYSYEGDRSTLRDAWEKRGPDGIKAYQQENNRASIDGLPGLCLETQ